MKKFINKKEAKHCRSKAIVLSGVLALGILGTVGLTTSCETPTQEKPVVPTTYSTALWDKTITVKDERSDKTASIDILVSKLQTSLTTIASGLDTIEADSNSSNPSKASAANVKSAMTTALNRGFTITISDTTVTSTEKVKVFDNKTILINSDFLTTADFSWTDKLRLDINNPSADLDKLMHSMFDSGNLALNLKTKNAIQLAVKPAMLAQKSKRLAALDMKKRNNNAIEIVLI